MKADSQKLQQWRERYDALSLRERSLVLLVIIVLAHTLWNNGFMRMLHKQQQNLLAEVHQSRKSISDIDKKIQMISAQFDPKGKSAALQRIKQLQSEIQRINQVKKDVTVGFIRPQQMVEVLKGLLNKEPGLKLISFQSQDVEPLFGQGNRADKKTQAGNSKINTNVAQTTTNGGVTANYPEVYKHAVVIQFSGTYRSTVQYLQSLESLPWKFYWDGLAYEVKDYPKAIITINVFTLSLEKGWIGV